MPKKPRLTADGEEETMTAEKPQLAVTIEEDEDEEEEEEEEEEEDSELLSDEEDEDEAEDEDEEESTTAEAMSDGRAEEEGEDNAERAEEEEDQTPAELRDLLKDPYVPNIFPPFCFISPVFSAFRKALLHKASDVLRKKFGWLYSGWVDLKYSTVGLKKV